MADTENTPAQPTELPTDLTALTGDELDQLLTQARDESAELQSGDLADLSDEQVTRLEALADLVDAVAERQVAIETERTQRAERAAAAAERLAGPTDDGDENADEDADSADEDAEAPAPEAVAAGGTRTAPRPAPRRQPTPRTEPAPSRTTIVASAELGGGFRGGQTLERSELVAAFLQRTKGQRNLGSKAGTFSQLSVATIERRFDADQMLTEDQTSDQVMAVLASASQESRLEGGNLVAAGGWCSPSEPMYGLPSDETTAGLIDLPTVGVNRGGISYTPGPDYADIFTSAGFFQTEAEAIAGTTKACVEVDCPDFQEVRLDAVGMCVKAPLLTRAAYPEAIARWISGTEVALQHKIAARLITAMRNSLGAVYAPTLTGTPVSWGLLTLLELTIEGERQARALSDTETLEVVAPIWARWALRADMANRNGIGKESVSNADIAQHFSDRGAVVQFVRGYQPLVNPIGVITIPTTMEVMVYTAGTFVKGVADVVSLDTIYDTADLQTNVFTAAFVEDGVLLAKMKHGGRKLQVPVRITGELGSPQIDDTFGGAQVENAGAAAA